MKHLDDESLKDYFSGEGTVARWWDPGGGVYAYHFMNQLRVLESFGPPPSESRVLDVGTGRGLFSIWFAQQGCVVDAVDLSTEMLAIAETNAGQAAVADRITFHQGDAESLIGFDEGAYDWVSCMQTFDHIPNLKKGVQTLSARVKPGGYFVFTYVPKISPYAGLYGLYRLFVSKFYRPNEENYLVARTYATRQIDSLMAEAGIDMEAYYGIGLTCLALRPELECGILTAIPRWINRLEESLFPFYRSQGLARHCTHVIGIGRKQKSA